MREIGLLVVLGIWLLFVVIYFYYFFRELHSKKAPYLGSWGSHLRLMKKYLDLSPADALVDLGCGDGKALRFFAKHYDIRRLDGYEIHGIAIFRSKIVQFFSPYKKRINIFAQSFEKADLSSYDYIYVYLLSNHLSEIEEWVFSTMKGDAIIICNTFQFSAHRPFQIIEDTDISSGKIYLYKKG